MRAPERIAEAARRRAREATSQREDVFEAVRAGRPLDAEPSRERLVRRFEAAAGVSRPLAEALAEGADPRSLGLQGDARSGAERVQGRTRDFFGPAWLELARSGTDAVGRVVTEDLEALGSGFLITDRLFLTNNHVVRSEGEARRFLVEFDYELDRRKRPRAMTRFTLDPGAFFYTVDDDDLDFTVVALGERVDGEREAGAFGCCPLIATEDKHVLTEFVNIVQHPDGDYKQVVFRENRLVTRLPRVLHYMSDTLPGSSGSPVFNDDWEVVALHHWGEPYLEVTLPDGSRVPRDLNEGVRVSAIARELERAMGSMAPAERALLQSALRPVRPTQPPPAMTADRKETARSEIALRPGGPVQGPDGAVTWTIPIEVTVRIGGAAGDPTLSAGVGRGEREEASGREGVRIDRNYENRRGYDPDFLPGHPVPLPGLGGLEEKAARKLEVAPGEDPHELRYQHFSIVMHAERRLAIYTACNIDGQTWVDIDRDTGRPRGEAEAREVWYDDPRIEAWEQSDQELYDRQRPRRLFDRGHLVRRQDPTWGTAARAVRANADTFHFTNCTPQESVFNQNAAHWQGIERWILEQNAVAERERVTVFSGPVLEDDDPEYRYVRVPRAFWKVVVFVEGGELRATAVLASQAERIERLPEGAGRLAEALDRLPEGIAEYQTTVAEIEALTGLDFGDLREYDTAGGSESARRRLRSFRDLRLKAPGRPGDDLMVGRGLGGDEPTGED